MRRIRNDKKSRPSKFGLLGYGALWAVVAAMVGFILLFLTGYGFSFIEAINTRQAAYIAYMVYNLFIAVSCYFICRRYPSSIYLVVPLANAMGIISSILETGFWDSSLWILVVSGWILSAGTSIAGFIRTKKIYQ